MSFLTQFLNYFDEEQKNSELVKILGAIGVNMEKAIYQEIDAQGRSARELIQFERFRLQSWLAYLLKLVPNRTSSHLFTYLRVTKAPDYQIDISKGTVVTTQNGIAFTVDRDVTISTTGNSGRIGLTQGERKETIIEYMGKGTIRLLVPDIDFTTEISSFYDDGTTDLDAFHVYAIGDNAQRVPIPKAQFTADTVMPYNGWFAFYINDILHVEIYDGPDVEIKAKSDNVTGTTLVFSYIVSDGAQGNIPANSLGVIEGIDLANMEYSFVQESDVMNGADTPDNSTLHYLLRNAMLNKSSVSSLYEYKTWLMAQNTVGDCQVSGDYQNFLATGELHITNKVVISVLDIDGEPMEAVQENGIPVQGEPLDDLNRDLLKVADLSIIRYIDVSKLWHYFDVEYTSATNDETLIKGVPATLLKYYDIKFNKQYALSLFDSLDLNMVTTDINFQYSPLGLRIKPYYYFGETVPNDEGKPGTLMFNIQGTFTIDPLDSTYESFFEWVVWNSLSNVWTVGRVYKEQPATYGDASKVSEIFPVDPNNRNTIIGEAVGYRAPKGYIYLTDETLKEYPYASNGGEPYESGGFLRAYLPCPNFSLASMGNGGNARYTAPHLIKVSKYAVNN
jgi:hypothetical protein